LFDAAHGAHHLVHDRAAMRGDVGGAAGQLPRLARNIDSVLLLSGHYNAVQAQAWLENWQGLKHAIETRQHIEIEHFRNEAISQEPFWLHSGKR